MADKARGKISMTPVVTIEADIDADAVDAIHHDIKGSLGGKLEYTKVDANDKWFYTTTKSVTGTSGDLIPDGSIATEGGSLTYPDDVRFLFLKNTGTTDGTTATSSKVYLCLDGGDAASVTDVIEIGPGEAINLKFKASGGVDQANLHAASSSGTVRCIVAAIIDDGG
tara:strand:+ start:2412 stop:2915 length:504 start_codon:yes stop_codon:yes gene_type:complete